MEKKKFRFVLEIDMDLNMMLTHPDNVQPTPVRMYRSLRHTHALPYALKTMLLINYVNHKQPNKNNHFTEREPKRLSCSTF